MHGLTRYGITFCRAIKKDREMIRKDLIEEVANKTGLHKSIVKQVTDTFLDMLAKSLSEGKRVELRGFGVFETRKMKSKKARNPRTGESVIIPERDKIIFRTSRILGK
jgi:DNA-binding protein HU-beta/integration host factor subunit beta